MVALKSRSGKGCYAQNKGVRCSVSRVSYGIAHKMLNTVHVHTSLFLKSNVIMCSSCVFAYYAIFNYNFV